MKKHKFLLSVLAVLSTMNIGFAADISTWAGFNTIEDILLTGDIQAEGTPQSIVIGTSTTPQTIDGGQHSLTGASGYQIKVSAKPALTIQNFGNIVDGTEGSHTFSYADTNGNIIYKTITKSINGFNKAPIQPNSMALSGLTVDNVVYTGNSGPILDVWLKQTTDTASITNTVFYGNTNSDDDKAILSLSRGNITIDNLIFDSNNMGTWSEGLEFIGGSNTSISNSIFQNNSTKAYGTLQLSGGTVDIDSSQFINNSTQYYDGGAMSVTSGLQNITNSIFKGNSAGNDGGAIWYAQIANSPYFVNTTFEDNQSTGLGGALYIGGTNASTGTISIIDSIVKGNKGSYGGGIYTYKAINFFAVDTDFTENEATEGGAIYAANENLNIFANTKDVTFSGNIANNTTSTYNGGAAVYFEDSDNNTDVAMNVNAASGKKVIFDNTIAAYGTDVILNVNKSGLTYDDINGNSVTITNAGEIQFNDRVGDEEGNIFNINLFGGTLSIGQNADINATSANADGYINDNNFYVKGNSTLSTVNGLIGEFAPNVFSIDNGVSLDWQFDVDLANTTSDTIGITENNGTLKLSSFNVISDSTTENLKIKYSNTNVGGVVKDNYTITTSTQTYDVTAENDDTGSYVLFTISQEVGGLPNAIKTGANQYIITDGQDENVTAWTSATGNVITSDLDINANGHAIYTENGIDGMVVSANTNVALRNTDNLSGFNNALTNNGGILSVIDSNISGNSGTADIINNSGSVIINAATKDINIGSDNTQYALSSDGGTIDVQGTKQVTFNGDVNGANNASMSIAANTTFNGSVSNMDVVQSAGTVNLKNLSGSTYTLNDGNLNIDEGGSFAPSTFELNNGTAKIADETAFSPAANTLNGGSINIANNNVGNLNLNSLTLNDIINLAVDVDMNQQAMDSISATSVTGSGEIKVNKFNLISETNNPNITINFVDDSMKNFVSTDVKSIEGKIFKYNVGYNSETGQFSFSGGGGSAGGYSPSIMAAPIAAEMGGFLAQAQTLQSGFYHLDRYTKYSAKERLAAENANKYAVVDANPIYRNEELAETSKAFWVVPYTSFESVNLRGGAKVHNITYGSIFGGDSQLVDVGHGFKRVISAFIGYDGAHQSYNGISSNQEGGQLGITGTWYKGNFFTAVTASVGASAGQAYTRFGTDNFTMLAAGIANKTGYNIEFFDGKFIVQPQLYTGYIFTNPFDYTNSAGVKISSDPLNAIQLAPGIKFIGNLKDGLQVYAGVDVMINFMGETKYRANDTRLPELSVKPYVQYGVGVQKTWGDRFTSFFQTMLRSGGRNGVALQLGFRWALGRSKPKNKNINNQAL